MIVYPYIQVLRLLADLHLVSPPCLAVAVVPPGLQHQAQALQPGTVVCAGLPFVEGGIGGGHGLVEPVLCRLAGWPGPGGVLEPDRVLVPHRAKNVLDARAEACHLFGGRLVAAIRCLGGGRGLGMAVVLAAGVAAERAAELAVGGGLTG